MLLLVRQEHILEAPKQIGGKPTICLFMADTNIANKLLKMDYHRLADTNTALKKVSITKYYCIKTGSRLVVQARDNGKIKRVLPFIIAS